MDDVFHFTYRSYGHLCVPFANEERKDAHNCDK